MSKEATKHGFSFICVDFVIWYFLVKDACVFVFNLFIFVLWCEVVSPCYRRWCSNLNEPLDQTQKDLCFRSARWI